MIYLLKQIKLQILIWFVRFNRSIISKAKMILKKDNIIKAQAQVSIEEMITENNAEIYDLQKFLNQGTKRLNKIINSLEKITEKIQRGF